MNARSFLAISAFAVALVSARASAGFVEYHDKDDWLAVIGAVTTIGFVGYPSGTLITDQYLELDVTFADGNDQAIGESFALFPDDGWGLDSNGTITLDFTVPQAWIAADFLGNMTVELYREGRLIYSSGEFGFGGIGNFGGIVAGELFDRAIIADVPGEVFVDDIFFGGPGPGIRRFEFEVDGALPSVFPDVCLNNSSGNPFAVENGLLLQRTNSLNGNFSFHYPNCQEVNGGLSPERPLIMEARLKVLAAGGSTGVYFSAEDGTHRYLVQVVNGGSLAVLTDSGGEPVNVTINVDIFECHTYRLESPAQSSDFAFYVDGVLALEATAIKYWDNGFGWGDGATPIGSGGDVDWDFVRFLQLPCGAGGCASCQSDIDGNGVVEAVDLLVLLGHWGTCEPVDCSTCPGDLTMDGSVGTVDLLKLLGDWGPCPAPP